MATEKTPSFEELITRLEALVSRLESGELSLAESLDTYGEAVALSRRCTELLGEAEQRVRILQGGADGVTELPFVGEAE